MQWQKNTADYISEYITNKYIYTYIFIYGFNTLRYSHANVVYCRVISSHTLHSLSICSLSCPQNQMNLSNILIQEGTLPGVLNHFFKHRKIGLSVYPAFLYQAAALWHRATVSQKWRAMEAFKPLPPTQSWLFRLQKKTIKTCLNVNVL